MTYLAKLLSVCGCSREMWLDKALPTIDIPLYDEFGPTLWKYSSVDMSSRPVRYRRYRLVKRIGSVLEYHEELEGAK